MAPGISRALPGALIFSLGGSSSRFEPRIKPPRAPGPMPRAPTSGEHLFCVCVCPCVDHYSGPPPPSLSSTWRRPAVGELAVERERTLNIENYRPASRILAWRRTPSECGSKYLAIMWQLHETLANWRHRLNYDDDRLQLDHTYSMHPHGRHRTHEGDTFWLNSIGRWCCAMARDRAPASQKWWPPEWRFNKIQSHQASQRLAG